MEDGESLIYIIAVLIALILISRLISYILGIYYVETEIEAELYTFIIVCILDAIAMYVMVKYGHNGGIGESINLLFIKSFPFILFYILGIALVYWFIQHTITFINFLQI